MKYTKESGNLPFGSVKGLTDELCGFKKSRKPFIFLIDSYLNDSTFTVVKRGAKS